MKTWNDRLALALAESEYKPNQLATVMKVSAPTVAAWIGAGTIKRAENITGENLIKVCRLLKVRPEWLVFGEKPMRPGEKSDHIDAVTQFANWPFKFSREAYEQLPSRQRDLVQAYAQAFIDDSTASNQKREA